MATRRRRSRRRSDNAEGEGQGTGQPIRTEQQPGSQGRLGYQGDWEGRSLTGPAHNHANVTWSPTHIGEIAMATVYMTVTGVMSGKRERREERKEVERREKEERGGGGERRERKGEDALRRVSIEGSLHSP